MITIIAMTWKEMLRKRVMLLTLLMTVVFIVAFWFVAQTLAAGIGSDGADLIMRFERGAIIITLGFFFGSFVVAFLSIFSSFSVIAGEAEQGVLLALLPRPIARWEWFLGRWIGYVSLGIGYAGLLFASILWIASVHATVPGDEASLAKSFLLFAGVVPLLISVSMLGSCIFSALGNGVFMTMLYGAGWLGGMIEKVAATLARDDDRLQPLETISGLMSLVMPADSLQRRMLAELFNLSQLNAMTNLNNNLGLFGLGHLPSNSYLLYAACYTAAALALGHLMFRRKDL